MSVQLKKVDEKQRAKHTGTAKKKIDRSISNQTFLICNAAAQQKRQSTNSARFGA